MQVISRTILFCLLCLLAAPALGQQNKEADLPRVLIIGDDIYAQQMRAVPTELKGKAEVVIPRWEAGEVANTSTALAVLDRLLGHLNRDGKLLPKDQRPKWDLIHFNLGLGDLVYRAPGMQAFRVMPIHKGGVRATSPDDYRTNLDELVKRLKETGAKLVWASTTPIRHSTPNLFELGSEVEYNHIAAEVMAKHGVPINDMYSHAKSVMDMDKPAAHGADPFNFDRKSIHEPVTDTIARALKIKIDRPDKE